MTKLNTIMSFFKISVLSTVLLGLSFGLYGATIYSNAVTGNWSSTTSWNGGVIPTSADDVVIVSGATITANVDATINSLRVIGTLKITSTTTLTVNESVIVESSGALSLNTGGSTGGFLAVYGNYDNYGTTDIWKGNIVVAGDYYDEHVTLQNNGNLVVGGEFTASISASGSPSVYILNPNVTPVINPSDFNYETVPPTGGGDADLITIINTVINDASCAITINTQPSNFAGCEGQNAVFSVSASPIDVTYQWQVNNGTEFSNLVNGTNVSGATSSSLTLSNVTASMNNYSYRCKITKGCTKTSYSGYLSVNPSVTVGVTIKATPVSDCEGQPITFSINTISNQGTSPTYQWLVNTVPEATTATYSYNALNGDKVQLKVTSNVSCATNPGQSNILDMVMYPLPPPNPITAN